MDLKGNITFNVEVSNTFYRSETQQVQSHRLLTDPSKNIRINGDFFSVLFICNSEHHSQIPYVSIFHYSNTKSSSLATNLFKDDFQDGNMLSI